MTVASKSPLTGTVGDASVGGKFCIQMKRAGWDGIIFTGRSKTWIGLHITDGKVEFAPAENLKGKTTGSRAETIKERGATAVIGPAAENGALYANIMFDGHYSAGRNGLGLVMGHKKLSFVTAKGSVRTAVFNRNEIMEAREEIFRLANATPIIMGDLGITHYGTAALFDLTSSRRMMPTDNFRKTWFEGTEKINAFSYKQKYGSKKNGCAGCHILCKKKGLKGEVLPEFETMNHFHSLLNNRDTDVVIKANAMCNEMGLDTITAGATLSCYAELEGRDLDPEEIPALIEDIGLSRGVGEQLKAGSWRYANSLGKVGASMSVKKLEMPAYDPRGAYGMALGYALSTRGGCHLRAYPISHEILRRPVITDRFSFSGKARIIKIAEDTNAIIDSLIACKFIFFAASLEEYSKALSGATGLKISGQDLLKIGERIYYHDRIMNALCGFDISDDSLPERFFSEAGTHGNNIKIHPIPRDDFEKARSDYYRVRGLSSRGTPTREKAEELELEWKN
jgi:aldehyde:ferredoxin oxidoreductase